MDPESVQPILHELFSSLEPLETQSDALLQFLKAKGLVSDEELAPFLEQAANTASVRWRAVRIRTAALIANLLNPPEEESFARSTQSNAHPSGEDGDPQQENLNETQAQKEGESKPKSASGNGEEATSERENTKHEDAEKAA